ncbi:uncharacterized protein MONOS_1438 [Monocercomonoides exilis]|uniref:uncharacterized protein n=1 Tax=Monocercomonoides exilis TaxID=2049356 RepID=UPI00355A7D7F|nr:hypothetical protein MONOS_1438 [Monocercomonoides exilis]|eukprot:MONOS_1438.1-p1 / transcript=MONOS_1438.1 / gene=MONOS_1438 / organism=Monocercomonoides_exilis_PA203 / gene_product=unspecified product / transcript_product=unspecified product / location=Mono_scaffold00025:185901-188048(+) / protein_length=716 / sequence_SO=supercontig / SO=protein_coding / is_pseudo=false
MFRGIFYLPIEETKEFIGKDITQTRKINEGHFEKPKHSQKKHIKDLAPPYTRADFFADMGFILEKNKSFKHLDSERNEINASNCSSETNHLYSAEGGTFATKEENERGIGQDYSPSADSSPGGQMPARMNTPDEDVSFMFSKWTPFATKEMRFFNDVELVVDGHVESAFAAKEKEKMLRKWEKDDVALLNSNEVLKEPESGERGCSIDEEKAEESAFKSRRMAVIARQIKEAKQYQKRYGIWCRKGWISDEEEGKMWDEAERKLSCKELKEDIEDCQPTANSRISSLNMLDDSRGIDLFEMGKRTCEQESPRFFDEINESREKAKELIAKDKCVECIRQKKTEFDRNMKLTRNEVMNLDDNEITTKKENEAGEICESYQKTESLPFLKLDEESKGTANEHICLAEPSFHQNWIDFCSVKSTDGLESSFKQDEFSSLANVEKITLHNTKRRDFLNSQCNMQSNSDLFLNSSSNSEENPSQLHLTPFGLHPFKEPSFAIQRNSLNFGSELSSLNKPDFSSSFSQSDCSNITSAVQTPSITSFSSKHTSLPLSADLRGISTFSSSISTILNERHQLLTNSSSSAVHLCLSNDLCEDEPEHVILSPKNEGEIPSVSTIRVVLDENEWLSRYNDPTIPRKKIYKMIKRNKNVVGFIQDMYEIYDLVKDSPPLITPIHCTSTDSVTLIRDRKQRAKIFWKTFCELEKGVFMNSDWPFICCS